MNKAFKVVWSSANNTWQVASERTLSSGSSRSISVIFILPFFTTPVFGAEEIDVPAVIRGKQTVIIGEGTSGGKSAVIGVGRDADLTLKGVDGATYIEFTPNEGRTSAKPVNWGAFAIATAEAIPSVNRKMTAEDNVVIRVNTHSLDSLGGSRGGVNASMGGNFVFNKSLSVALENMISSSSRPEHYGIKAGSGNDEPDGLKKETYSQIIIKENYDATMSMSSPYALSTIVGIRAIGGNRHSTTAPYPILTENSSGLVSVGGKTTISVDGGFAQGIYVSGGESKVILNDSSITMKNGLYGSAAFKIGKARNVASENLGTFPYGAGKGMIESHGNMVIDTSASEGSAIQMMSSGSSLMADYAGSSSYIRAKQSVLEVGALDWTVRGESDGIKAFVKDADWQTTSNNVTLIEVAVNQKNVQLGFSGSQTALKAADQGWLLNVSANSSADFSLREGHMYGLVNKAQTGTLSVEVADKAVWHLTPKGSSTSAVLNTLTLSRGGMLHAASSDSSNNVYTLSAHVINNQGVISLDNPSHGKYSDMLTIDGNYTGTGQAEIRMNTLWNSTAGSALPALASVSTFASDMLNITGSAQGTTVVKPIGSNGAENIIDGNIAQVESALDSQAVITVQQSGVQAFTGQAKTTGAAQVQLAKRSNGATDEYYWTMLAKTPAGNVDIYDPATSAYVQMPRANMEAAYTTLGTLHERRGEYKGLACTGCDDEQRSAVWTRLLGRHVSADGRSRLNMNSDIYGVQIGRDLVSAPAADGGERYTSAYIAYTHSDLKFYDRYRAENGIVSDDHFTGKGGSHALTLGLTHTNYSSQGGYVDLVGQLSYLHNKYETRNDAGISQHGGSAVLSAEAGYPLVLKQAQTGHATWIIEPQSQLMYQFMRLAKMNDGTHHINQHSQHGLRGRIGARLAYHPASNVMSQVRPYTLYGIANIWHDFTAPKTVAVGRDRLKETYNSVWGELGLGAQLPLTRQTYLYADIRYERDFGGTARKGYRGNVAFKYHW